MTKYEDCSKCDGFGWWPLPNHNMPDCTECKGRGQVAIKTNGLKEAIRKAKDEHAYDDSRQSEG
jgi:DnaJ-class molecular chaperone